MQQTPFVFEDKAESLLRTHSLAQEAEMLHWPTGEVSEGPGGTDASSELSLRLQEARWTRGLRRPRQVAYLSILL